MPKFEVLVRQCAVWMFATLTLLSFHANCHAQVSAATLSIHIVDGTGAGITNASVVIRNTDNDQQQHATSGKTGSATFSFLKPGHYALRISKDQFSDISVEDLTLNTGDDRHVQLVLKVGSAAQTVNVDGDGLTINTTDASMSTVIDHKFVENTPLNGRSFQSLILSTPGTVTNSPQRSSAIGSLGEFSVNGQRTESNYYLVDGVSATTGTSAYLSGAGANGSLPASTALGTTQALVSVDALQEFRVVSSTYSAEFGRSPGGQFSMVTRSGTNNLHGSGFDYFRNDALDANSWFDDNTTPPTKKPAERQNDFGGTFGGPLRIPHLYNGTNQSFFFFSYEGLRVTQPMAATVNYVPTIALRQSVVGPLQQALNSFPLPTQNAADLGNGLGEFIGAWSNPSRADATSLRLDHNLGQRTHLFFRFSDTPSNGQTRGTSDGDSSPSVVTVSRYTSQSYTFGATTHISAHIDNDIRVITSSAANNSTATLDSFGGATAANLNALQSFPRNGTIFVGLDFGAYYPQLQESTTGGSQKQWNIVDTFNLQHENHALKIGVDWRRLSSAITQTNPDVTYLFLDSGSVAANKVDEGFGSSFANIYPVFNNFSAFAQDAWHAGKRVSLSMGLRWDVNPPPSVSKGLLPYTASNIENYSSMVLAPQGTRLWDTRWYNLAPRLGIAYILNSTPGQETVIRGGAGVFFDSGQQAATNAFQGPGFSSESEFGTIFGNPTSFPGPVSLAAPIIVAPPVAPYSAAVYASPRHFESPFSYEWNVSLEHALGQSQTLTISYVGANGRKLLEESYVSSIGTYNPNFSALYIFKNGLTSSYNSLQVKYQKQIVRGLQALASYSWSHSLDFGSFNEALAYQHGNSDQDIRHNATVAVSYDLPHSGNRPWLHVLTSNWGSDGRFTSRTGFPITFNGLGVTDPHSGAIYYGGLNLVPGVPLYLYGPRSSFAGGRVINPAAFAKPVPGTVGDAPRNFVNGFGVIQTDLAIRRSIPVHDRVQLQLRAEAFNLFNHPNFGAVNSTFGNVQFGKATAILSQSLGTLSPLYQMGGPRSLQLSLKLTY